MPSKFERKITTIASKMIRNPTLEPIKSGVVTISDGKAAKNQKNMM